tara:strand:+ start:571 stop:906 length:336 start_codon:yes stop_codon:yes gene_type:complete
MTNHEFDKMFDQVVKKCKATLGVKKEEYARGDRLSNFKHAGLLEKCTPVKACRGMLTKHVISIYDFVDDHEAGIEHTVEEWDTKIIDNINYLILKRGLIIDAAKKRLGTKK